MFCTDCVFDSLNYVARQRNRMFSFHNGQLLGSMGEGKRASAQSRPVEMFNRGL